HTSELQSLTNLVCRLLLEKKTCARSEEHTSELQSLTNLVCRLLLEKINTHRNPCHGRRSARGGRRIDRCDSRTAVVTLGGAGATVRYIGSVATLEGRVFFFLMIRRPRRSPLFPYATLFR